MPQMCVVLKSSDFEGEESDRHADRQGQDLSYPEGRNHSRIPASSKKKQNTDLSPQMDSTSEQKAQHIDKPKADTASKATKLPKEIGPARQRILRLRDERDQLRNRITEKKAEIANLKKQIAERDDNIDQLKACLQKADNKNEELERTFRKIHDDQLDLLGKDDLDAEPDDEVLRKLNSLFRESKAWAEGWCILDWNSEDISEYGEMLHLSSGQEKPFASLELLEAIRARKISPKVVLNALLNVSLCDATLSRPFLHLRKYWEVGDSTTVEEALNLIMQFASKESKEALRAHIFHAIRVPRRTTPEQLKQTPRFEHVQQMCDTHCNNKASSLLSRYCKLLNQCTDEDHEVERLNGLLVLFNTAMSLSTSLFAQKPEILVSFDLNRCFVINSPNFTPHRGMKLKEDDDDEDGRDPFKIGIVGKPLDLVIEPTILKAGDKDGKNYDQVKVMHVGIVWVVSEDQQRENKKMEESYSTMRRSSSATSAPKTKQKARLNSPDGTESLPSRKSVSTQEDSSGLPKRNRQRREDKRQMQKRGQGNAAQIPSSAASSISRDSRGACSPASSDLKENTIAGRLSSQKSSPLMTSKVRRATPNPNTSQNIDQYEGFFTNYVGSKELHHPPVKKVTEEMQWKDVEIEAIASADVETGIGLRNRSLPPVQQGIVNLPRSTLPQKAKETTVSSSQDESRVVKIRPEGLQQESLTSMQQPATDNLSEGLSPLAGDQSNKRKRSDTEMDDGGSDGDCNCEESPEKQIKQEY